VEELWALAWKGAVSNDSLQPVRRGLAAGFHAEPAVAPGSGRRAGRTAWQASRPAEGSWFRIEQGEDRRDALDEEEVNRDRARQVLRRHGVVFRELLESEPAPLGWSRLFRSLRLMELSGEVVAGRFFEGVRGIQFALPSALEILATAAGPGFDDAVYWMNAADPCSVAGVGIEGLEPGLPPRLPTTHLVFHGAGLALVSRRRGRDLEFRVPPGSPVIPRLLGFVRALAGGGSSPLAVLHVETVNGEPAPSSPWAPALVQGGFAADYRRLTWRPGLSAP
jgi:ATP-dependent Lhr-like helicase